METNCGTQNIAAVRQARNDDESVERAVECLVWTDKDKDYTDKFIIEKYMEAL